MSHSEEPSYYEIALTNRQVVVAFTLLLAGLLASFLAGVWFSRDGGAAAAEAAASQPAEAGTLATVDMDAEAGDEGLPELRFFADDPQEAAKPEPPPEQGSATPPPAVESRPERTLTEDLDASDPAPRQPEAQKPAPASASKPEPSASQPEPSASKPEPSASKPEPTASKPATTAPRPTEAKPAPSGPSFIQVFSTRDRVRAQEMLERMELAGYPAALTTLGEGAGAMHRVRLGPYGDRARAEAVADEVRRKYKLDIWITSGG